MSQSPASYQDRARVSQACKNCREKKSKCDGARPVCGPCQQKSLGCQYGITKREKSKQAMQELTNKVARYESMLKRKISTEQGGFHPDGQGNAESTTALAVTDPMATSNMSGSNSSLPPLCQNGYTGTANNSPTTTSQRILGLRSPLPPTSNLSETWSPNPSDPMPIPPRPLLESACNSFFNGAAVMFTFFDREEFSRLLEAVYAESPGPKSMLALIQTCAAAAVGCQYQPLNFDATTRLAFLSIVKSNLDHCVEESSLSAMRVMAMLCLYFTFEKRTAALMYADTGLRLAKLNRNVTTFYEYPTTTWQRVSQSLVCLDCLLCATTGHLPSSHSRDLYPSPVLIGTECPSVEIAVQVEITKISMLSSSILQDIYHSRYFSTATVTNYKNQLQQWLLRLPEYMRLDHLLSSDDQTPYSRSIFIIHLLYQTTVILVYRRAMIEFTCHEQDSVNSDAFDQAQTFLEPCLWTARQASKILQILMFQRDVVHKSWPINHATYSTGTVLLYFATNRLLHDDSSHEITTDLPAVKQCINALSLSGEMDETAKQYSRNLLAIHDSILEIYQAPSSLSEDNTAGEEATARSEKKHCLAALSASFLIHPFDGGHRRELETLQDEFIRSVVDDTAATLATDHLNAATLLSANYPSTQENSSFGRWRDALLTKTSIVESSDRGKGKDPDQVMKDVPFNLKNGVMFGS